MELQVIHNRMMDLVINIIDMIQQSKIFEEAKKVKLSRSEEN